MDQIEELKDTLTAMVRLLVDKTEEVTVSVVPDLQPVTMRVLVDPSDLGKVIGKQGRMARAIRTITAAHGHKTQQPVAIDIQTHATGATQEDVGNRNP